MIAVAVCGALLGLAAFVDRELRRMFPRTPAEWAWKEAATFEQPAFASSELARKCRELANHFERSGESWAESTLRGPFTDRFASGESVVIHHATRTEATDLEGRQLRDSQGWPVAEGVGVVVMRDWAGDDDDCDAFRGILVRFVDGPHRGEVACIERVYLRRR